MKGFAQYLKSSLGNAFEGIGADRLARLSFSGVDPYTTSKMVRFSPTLHSAIGYGLLGAIPGAVAGGLYGKDTESALLGALAGATGIGVYGMYSGHVPTTVPSWI